MPPAKGSGYSLKDELFNRKKVEYLAGLFHRADSEFDQPRFVAQTMKRLKRLELKQRITHIAEILEGHLSSDYRQAVKQIVAALPPPLDPKKFDDDFGDFIFAPLGEFVVRNGLENRHLKLSLKTLKALTMRFSMEYAIRDFINAHPDSMMVELTKWSTDPNYHVRRLVSEGTRPMLPWAKRITINPESVIELLDVLHADPTRYVTRSVANHLNDISKSDPQLVLDSLKRWSKQGDQDDIELAWLGRHALRTLVKRGDAEALKYLGFRDNPNVKISNFSIRQAKIVPGESLEFSFVATAARDERLMLDYVIEFVKSNGSLSPKVHKIKQVEITKGESLEVVKRHVFRANATTYTLYPGVHYITLQVNGRSMGRLPFSMSIPD